MSVGGGLGGSLVAEERAVDGRGAWVCPGEGGYRATLLFSLLEKSRWVPTGTIGGGGEDCKRGLRALDSAPLREKGVDEGENDTNR